MFTMVLSALKRVHIKWTSFIDVLLEVYHNKMWAAFRKSISNADACYASLIIRSLSIQSQDFTENRKTDKHAQTDRQSLSAGSSLLESPTLIGKNIGCEEKI